MLPWIRARTSIWVPVFSSFGYIPRIRIVGSGSSSMLNFLKDHQTIFYSGCTILLSHQQCVSVPISTHTAVLIYLFYYCHLNEWNGYLIVFLKYFYRTSLCGAAEMNPTRNHDVTGSIPGLIQWVKDLAWPWTVVVKDPVLPWTVV